MNLAGGGLIKRTIRGCRYAYTRTDDATDMTFMDKLKGKKDSLRPRGTTVHGLIPPTLLPQQLARLGLQVNNSL